MNLSLNGETLEFKSQSVAALITQTAPQKPFAVAVNTHFVDKGAYAETVLNENDKVDIVRPVVGG